MRKPKHQIHLPLKFWEGKVIYGLTLLKKTMVQQLRKDESMRNYPAWICKEEGTQRLVTITEKNIKRRNGAKNPWRARVREMFNTYSGRCRRKNVYWGLTLEEFYKLSQSNCTYCGCEPMNTCRKVFTYNGIDRKDNQKGYSRGNSVPCCGVCNSIKGAHLSFNEMKAAMRAVLRVRSKS